MGLVRAMRRPRTPRYTAADILGLHGQPATYPGGFRAYRRDEKAHKRYVLWHLWATRGKCSTCDQRFLEEN